MEFWKGKIAVITGAGEGIGAQIAKDLVNIGMIVVGFEPTEEKTLEMANKATSWNSNEGQFVTYKCDISKEEDLVKSFEKIDKDYAGIDLLINNAVFGRGGLICTGDIEVFEQILNVNIYGLIATTRLAMRSMISKGGGQVININSICGHYMPNFATPTINLYIASKKAMTVFNKSITDKCKLLKQNIKVTSISPGIVRTRLFETSGISFINDKFFEENRHLSVCDVSNVILKVLTLTRSINVEEIIVHALHETY